ncbi:hypothetical protein KSP39_PZI009295 [Platanthera zijinensis]|uniref:Uncharacterized protein n=1 Tax=Platanthera zijinensis TaxID=2320716 RepID=A0AAP0G855_9ASPA
MASLHLLIHFPNPTTKRSCFSRRIPSPSDFLPSPRRQLGFLLSCKNGGLISLPLGLNALRREGFDKVGILQRRGGRARLLVVRAKQVFGSGDGGWDKGSSSRVLGNLVLAIGLTYLTVTGQLGWLFDALVSIWIVNFFLVRTASSGCLGEAVLIENERRTALVLYVLQLLDLLRNYRRLYVRNEKGIPERKVKSRV